MIADPPDKMYSVIGIVATGKPTLDAQGRADTASMIASLAERAATMGADALVIRWVGSQMRNRASDLRETDILGVHAVAIRYRELSDPAGETWHQAGTFVSSVMDAFDETKLTNEMRPKRLLRSIRTGMTMDEVRGLLGNAESVLPSTATAGEQWTYTITVPDYLAERFRTFVMIGFDPQGRVTSINRDMWGWR